MASPGEQDAHTRHVGTAWRHQSDGISRRGEGVPDGTAGEAAALDLRHQTLASARNPQGFGGARRVRSSRPGGVGLDDRTAALAGSRRGPSPCPVFGLWPRSCS